MLRAAGSMAFFGMLRVSEYTCPAYNRVDPELQLMVSDVQIEGSIARIQIKQSKTDPFREGVVLRVGGTRDTHCPVTALKKYLIIRGNTQCPLFIFLNRAFLTRRDITTLLRNSFPGNININTHSFRIGGHQLWAQPAHPITLSKSWVGGEAKLICSIFTCLMTSCIVNCNTRMANPVRGNRVWNTDLSMSLWRGFQRPT